MKKINPIKWADFTDAKDAQVSNFGEVRRHDGFVYSLFKDKAGYLRVNLETENGTKQFTVHTIVAKLFVPNPFNKPQVNHKNGDRSNNCEWNLEWVTEYENQMHRRFVLGHGMNGEQNPMFGKTGEQNPKFKERIFAVDEDGNICGKFPTQTQAAKEMFGNVNVANQICRCLSHKRNNLICKGYYWLYETEYKRMTQADLKPRELMGNPNVWANAYRGQSLTKPEQTPEGSTTIESVGKGRASE